MAAVRPLSFTTLCSIGLVGLLLTHSLQAGQDISSISFHPIPLSDHATAANAVAEAGIAAVRTEAMRQTGSSASAFDRSIEVLTSRSGPFDPELAQLLQDKGMLLQQQGQHRQALEVLEQAVHILRVNYGLNDQRQFSLLRAMIASSQAIQDLPGADALQASLYRQQLDFYGSESAAAIAAYIEWADWNVSLYLRDGSRFAEDFPGQEQLNRRLTEAHNLYTSALQLQQKLGSDTASMIATERKLAAISFIVKQYMGDSRQAFTGAEGGSAADTQSRARQRADMVLFSNGKQALQRAIAYSASQEHPDYTGIAERMMELGDWYLLFDRRAAAVEVYEEVLALLNSVEVDEQDARRILMAGQPVQTPDTAYRQPDTDEFAGYIDVEFSLNKFGKASDLQILSSVGSDRRIEKALKRTIRSARFRPGFRQGSVAALDKMQLRYYYTL